jgi:hypothetical protein
MVRRGRLWLLLGLVAAVAFVAVVLSECGSSPARSRRSYEDADVALAQFILLFPSRGRTPQELLDDILKMERDAASRLFKILRDRYMCPDDVEVIEKLYEQFLSCSLYQVYVLDGGSSVKRLRIVIQAPDFRTAMNMAVEAAWNDLGYVPDPSPHHLLEYLLEALKRPDIPRIKRELIIPVLVERDGTMVTGWVTGQIHKLFFSIFNSVMEEAGL